MNPARREREILKRLDLLERDPSGAKLNDAEETINKFFDSYPDGARWIQRTHKSSKENFFAPNLFGGRRHLYGHISANGAVHNAMDRRGPNCVDTKTECLTATGWKTVDQLLVGELIYTKNIITGELELQPLRKIIRSHYNGKMWRLTNGIDGLVTPEHRWLVDWGKGGADRKTHRSVMKTSTELADSGNNNPIHLVADKAIHQKGGKWLNSEVSIIGWVLSDGYYETHKRRVRISQSERGNPKKVLEIDTLLSSISSNISKTGPDKLGKIVWTVPFELSDRIRAAMPNKVLTGSFLSELSTYQLQLLYDAMMQGNGTFDSVRGLPVSYCAGTRKKADMFAMLCTLLSIPCNIYYSKPTESEWQYASMGNVPSPTKKCWQVRIKQRRYSQAVTNRGNWVNFKGEVWCPNVENGTWIARRNGSIYVTGNSLIQGPLSQVGYVAVYYFEQWLDLLSRETKLPLIEHIGAFNMVHDSQEVEAPILLLPLASYMLEHACTTIIVDYFDKYNIPRGKAGYSIFTVTPENALQGIPLNVEFEVDQEIGPNLGETIKYDGHRRSMISSLSPMARNKRELRRLLENIDIIMTIRERELRRDLKSYAKSAAKNESNIPSNRRLLTGEDIMRMHIPEEVKPKASHII